MNDGVDLERANTVRTSAAGRAIRRAGPSAGAGAALWAAAKFREALRKILLAPKNKTKQNNNDTNIKKKREPILFGDGLFQFDLGLTGFDWVFLDLSRFHGILLGFTGFYWL